MKISPHPSLDAFFAERDAGFHSPPTTLNACIAALVACQKYQSLLETSSLFCVELP